MKKERIKVKKSIYLIILLAVAVSLAGCTTRAKQDARRSCDAASLLKFPYRYQEYTYVVSELIPVPSGTTICDTQYIMNTAQTVCKQQTKLVPLDKKINISVKEFIKFQQNKTSYAIAAISEPDRFFKSLDRIAIQYQSQVGLPDHHPLDAAFFDAQHADLLLITTKDAVKCRSVQDPRIWVVDTQAVFSDPRWVTSLSTHLTRRATSQPE